jgi:hypothetical protein
MYILGSLENHNSVIPAEEPEMESIPYLRERQLPLAPPSVMALPPTPLSEGGRGEKMPDSRIRCGTGKSGMTKGKYEGFQNFLTENSTDRNLKRQSK